jgi:hypothetical protein
MGNHDRLGTFVGWVAIVIITLCMLGMCLILHEAQADMPDKVSNKLGQYAYQHVQRAAKACLCAFEMHEGTVKEYEKDGCYVYQISYTLYYNDKSVQHFIAYVKTPTSPGNRWVGVETENLTHPKKIRLRIKNTEVQ